MSEDAFLLFRDRSRGWCAAPPPFRNILQHPIGRGETQVEAVQDLLRHPEFIHRGLAGEWPLEPDITDFYEVVSDRSFFATQEPPCRAGRLAHVRLVPKSIALSPRHHSAHGVH